MTDGAQGWGDHRKAAGLGLASDRGEAGGATKKRLPRAGGMMVPIPGNAGAAGSWLNHGRKGVAAVMAEQILEAGEDEAWAYGEGTPGSFRRKDHPAEGKARESPSIPRG